MDMLSVLEEIDKGSEGGSCGQMVILRFLFLLKSSEIVLFLLFVFTSMRAIFESY